MKPPKTIKEPTNFEIIHINKIAVEGYFYTWSSDLKTWIRGEVI